MYFCSFKVFRFSWSVFFSHGISLSLLCTVYMNGNVLSNLNTFNLWLNLLSYSPNDESGILLFFEAGTIFGWQSILDDCSYERKIQTIYLAFMFSCNSCHWHLFCHFFFSSGVCYFQHYTTFVITLLIVLMNIETNFFNTDFFFCLFSLRKKKVIGYFSEEILSPMLNFLRWIWSSFFDGPCLTYFYLIG